jgi:DNA-directed RNA polymerase sigma subunit (sigma70/sigma32)
MESIFGGLIEFDSQKELNEYMWNNFNDRELDIVINSVIKQESRANVATRYNISKRRVQYIYEECMRKLYRFMKMKGHHRMDDIL